jgi:lysophospholipase L1-like esterase
VAQTATVANVSANGRTAAQGEDLLPGVLSSTAPDVLLLMMGTNDIKRGARRGA